MSGLRGSVAHDRRKQGYYAHVETHGALRPRPERRTYLLLREIGGHQGIAMLSRYLHPSHQRESVEKLSEELL